MKIYIAWLNAFGTENKLGKYINNESTGIFERINMLESFYYVTEWQTHTIHRYKSFLLDSGAFTFAFGAGADIDWNEYVEKYADYIVRNNVTDYLELDIDALVGYDTVLTFRKRLETLTGRPTIPVWHLERGKDDYLAMCDKYDRVAIGGIATRQGRKKLEPYLRWFVREAHKRGASVHGLGYTSLKRLPEIGFDSIDSTSWLYGNIGGYVYVWNGNKMLQKQTKEAKRIATYETYAHNFLQWVQMAEDMENRT